ncbi:hypothetical protein ACFQAT_05790 [Undibacterium arcticum]|uniref:tetratricopeptide repeat protein n=1 Tax=Undibacterium arcticum TaxID=1762892 RepID=UPI00361F7537
MESTFIDRRPGSQDVCIAFSARDTAKGKFTFYSILSSLPAHVIFVNDFSNGWYLNGTPEFGDEAGLLNWLVEKIDSLKTFSGRVFTLGSSMGAYAALKYGSLLGADRIMALGPESELCIPLGRSVTSLQSIPEGAGNIASLPFKVPQDVLVLSGNNDIVDFYCACQLKAANPLLGVYLITNRTHVVAKYIDGQFGLSKVVNSFFMNGDTTFLIQAETSTTIDVVRATAIKKFNEILAIQKTVCLGDSDAIITVANEIPAWSMPQYFSALISEKQGDLGACEYFLQRALAVHPLLGRARLKMAQIQFKARRYRECVDLLEDTPASGYTQKSANC